VKRHAPASERNREPILEVLRRVLPARGLVVEIASGTGQHAVHVAAALPGITWQPTDLDPDALTSIAAWREEAGLANLRAPVALDVTAPVWPFDAADAIVCINMIHIAPWAASVALLDGAGRLLPAGGVLYTYGPYRFDGVTAPSNEAFDRSLRERDPAWGVRDVRDLRAAAAARGLTLDEVVAMPANNHSLVFRSLPRGS
jgi:SAM-dependent methyltransferase